MTKPSAKALRQEFLDFFARHDHTVVKSYPLVPANDPTLMFTNAGMVQFKDVFVGAETRAYQRATSSQKCMRVSGKHNDLEEVGRTPRHHTFFEMLGNFSFGDYFKELAIELCWRFLTDTMALERDRLYVTVFGGEEGIPADTEARQLWKKITGFCDDRVLDMDMKENFWSMGDTGPCGPCTEVHYDLQPGEPVAPRDFESGRMVEIWNNVFMQFERKASGEMLPLPAPSVDTGMGFERLVSVVQGHKSNYATDLFTPILETVGAGVGKAYGGSGSEDDVSMRVIADHARATAFCVADGVQPANEGRGYVLRRIMRRAIRHGKRLGYEELFFCRACLAVVEVMGDDYPELIENRTLIQKVADLEETGFRRTLDTGLSILGTELDRLDASGGRVLPGSTVFKLYDTYGFPKDLTEVIAAERSVDIDHAGFEQAMQAQRVRSRGGAVGEEAVAPVYKSLRERLPRPGEAPITFVGYTHEDEPVEGREGRWRRRDNDGTRTLEAEVRVVAIIEDGREVDCAASGVVEMALDPTPFYGEAGGQVGDHGVIVADGGLELEVITTLKPTEDLTISQVRILRGEVRVGQMVWAGYVPEIRKMTRAHHSATHILHASLRHTLGEHVKQAGSLVDPDHLRFDYSHFEAPKAAELATIEADANLRVRADDPVETEVLPFDAAKQKGAIALFGEKYGDLVRVVTMGGSVEFCGGTHVRRTTDIGLVLVTREEAVAAGVRRIEAEVGEAARRTTRATQRKLERAAKLLGSPEGGDAGESDPILSAVTKAVRQGHTGREQLQALGDEAAGGSARIEVAALPEEIGLAEARRVRDLWQGLVQLANARPTEMPPIMEKLGSSDPSGLLVAFAELVLTNRENERRIERAKSSQVAANVDDMMEEVSDVGGVSLLTAALEGVDGKRMREMADQLRDRLGSGVLCLCSQSGGKAALLVAITKDLTNRFNAGALVKELAPCIGGRGGGRAELAQAGGNRPEGVQEAFGRIRVLLGGG